MMEDKKPMKVYEKPCANCLLSKAHLVGDDVVRDRMVRSLVDRDSHFVCHKATLDGEKDVCCYSFWHKYFRDITHLRFAAAFNLVDFIPLPADQPRKITPEEYFGELERRENEQEFL